MTRAVRPAELVRRTAQALTALYGALAEDGGLTLPQFAVLDALLRHGPQTSQFLTKLTGIDRATMFLMLKRLQRAELVAQVEIESPKPGRNPKAITLTPRGRRALGKAETAVWNAEVQLMGKLMPAERGHFLNALAVTAYMTAPR